MHARTTEKPFDRERGSASYEALLLAPFLMFIMAATFLLAFDGLVIAGTEHGLLLGAAEYRKQRNEGRSESQARQTAETRLRSQVLAKLNGAEIRSFSAADTDLKLPVPPGFASNVASKLIEFVEKLLPVNQLEFRIEAERPPPVLSRVIRYSTREQDHRAEAGTWVWDEWRMMSGTVDDPPDEVGSLTGAIPDQLLDMLSGAIGRFFYVFGIIGQEDCW